MPPYVSVAHDAELVLDEALQSERGRQRVRIRIVVRVDEQRAAAGQGGQRALEIEWGTRRFVHGGVQGAGRIVEVVERQLGLPVVDGQVLVPGSGQRFGIGPGQERAAVDRPIERAASPRDREVIAAARLDADVGCAPPCARRRVRLAGR